MRKITAALIGAGGRGQFSYAPYALRHPDELEFVAVAEPRTFLRDAFVKTHRIRPERAFQTWEELLERAPIADCILICTQDNEHVEPALAAIRQGYSHILLEKPIDPDLENSYRLMNAAARHQVNIQVCHSLRYTPFFRKMKELLDRKTIGSLINIVHTEAVGFFHHAHSFVRGDWADTAASSSMILAKSCHDMDLIVYLTGKRCKSVSSYGALTHFKLANAPEGSTERCTDDCKVKDMCPYNAVTIYSQREDFRKLACEKEGFSDLDEALRKGRYGRCVYRCSNDAVDHQTVNLLLEDDITAVFTMSAFSGRTGRDIRIMGTMGEMWGSMEESKIHVHHFASGKTEIVEVSHPEAGHSGADEILMSDFVRTVALGKQGSSGIELSVQSHLMCHLAEKSRIENRNFNVSI